jgi:hypothetical protein
MPEQEDQSPVCRPGSKVGSGQPLSPGARSNPSGLSGPRFDRVPSQPTHGRAIHRNGEQPGEVAIVGP